MNILIQNYLDQALASIFKSSDQGGFWDEEKNRIIKRVILDETNSFSPDMTVEWRYAPFGLMGVLYWRHINPERHPYYDDQIKDYLNFIKNNLDLKSKLQKEISSFELGLLLSCFTMGYLIFQTESYYRISLDLYRIINANFKKITDSNSAFILFGLTWLYDLLIKMDDKQANEIQKQIKFHLDYLIQRQDSTGIYQIGDRYATYHQRICYLLWAIARSSSILKHQKSVCAIEKTLNLLLNARTLEDFGFKWHDNYHNIKLKYLPFKVPMKQSWGTDLLFSCHQAFFVIACQLYRKNEGARDFQTVSHSALEWIWGKNRKNINLVDYTTFGFPWRLMDLSGNLNIPGQNFIGAYEIGAYIMALSDLLIN